MKLRYHILIIGAATILPIFVFVFSVMYLLFEKQRDSQLHDSVATARALSLALDASFQRAIGTLNALSTSGHLQTSEFRLLYQEAQRVLAGYPGAESIILYEPSGQQIVNTNRPFGEALPPAADPEFLRKVAKDRAAAVANLAPGATAAIPAVMVATPVFAGDTVKYVLTMVLSSSLVQHLITQQHIPTDYVAAIIDANRTIVARNRDLEEYRGKRATPELIAKVSESREGWWFSAADGSEPLYMAHRCSDFTGWTVVIGVPKAKIEAPLRQAFTILIGGIGLFLLAALGVATLFARRIVFSIRALAAAAKDLGTGETPQLCPSPVAELDLVRVEIESAAEKRKGMEAALRDSESRLKAIIETEPECVKIVDLDGRVREMNRAGLEMLQADSLDELREKRLTDFVLPAYREAFVALHKNVIGGGSCMLEFEVVGLKGRQRWLETHATPLRDQTGNVVALLGVTRDITGRKRAEERLRDEFELVKKIADSAAEAIFVADSQGCITFANAEASKIFGFTVSELLGQPLHETLHHHYPDGRPFPRAECELRHARASQKTIKDIEQVFFRNDGSLIDVECTAAPLDSNERSMGYVLIVRDVTERKRLQDEIKARVDELAAADRRKNEFLATLAHELRNPLAPLSNAIDILKMPTISTEEFRWATDLMTQQMQHMTRLVDDLLDVNRISRDRLELRKERIDLVAIVKGAVEISRPSMARSAHNLTISPCPVPIYVLGDEVRLTQVFANLLDNAIKYTEANGTITIGITQSSDQVVVEVADNGIGIAPDQLARVFELFTQLNRSPEQNQGGLGIGLNLAKRLVEMHGGSIEAKSAGLGHGSQFIVRLPRTTEVENATRPSKPTSADGAGVASGKLHILVVDDNEESAETLALVLRYRGNVVSLAHDGEAAVKAALEAQPDIIILDIGLPKIDGYEACRRIRQHSPNGHVTIIALTGWSREEDRQRTREAGFDYHLVKPVSPSAVWRLISELSAHRLDRPVVG